MIKILFFSSSRADSGILSPLIRAAQGKSFFETKVAVCGGHIEASQGETLTQEFKYLASDQLEVLDFIGPENELVDSLPLGLEQFLGVLERERPSIVVLLGDRMETLLFAFAATIKGIPVAHIHGGDLTEGALDELHRHAITKLSSLHFPTSQASAKRILRMGESPDSVFNLGSPILDALEQRVPISDESFFEQLAIPKATPFFLITMHPAVHDKPSTQAHLEALLTALENLKKYFLVFTAPNLDPQGAELRTRIERFVAENQGRALFVKSLGSLYWDALEKCAVAIGNSSSLVLEAPYLGVRTVQIGTRQEGRTEGVSGLGADATRIAAEIESALKKPRPRRLTASDEGVSQKILSKLAAEYPYSTRKRFRES